MVEIEVLDLRDGKQVEAFIELLQYYASSLSGGGKPLSREVVRELPGRLVEWPGFVSFMAWSGSRAVGLINGFTGFSTFRARPLLNVHDVIVHEDFRRQGVARALFDAVERVAVERGYCKLTLEVLSGNVPALCAYEEIGFQPYELDPAMGGAIFMEKRLS